MFKRKPKIKKQLFSKQFNYSLFLIVIFLSFFGLLMIYETSSVSALYNFGNKFYFAQEQLRFIIFGIILMIFLANFDYHRLFNFSLPFILIEIILLILVFIPGIGVRTLGASRWLNFRFISFQPAELAKISLVIYLSAWFSSKEKRRLLAFFILMTIFGGLIMLQPDMGTAIILSLTSVFLYFIVGSALWQLVLIFIMGFSSLFILIKIAPYRLSRFLSFLNPKTDTLGISYHINQILIALGSGGFWGVGLGKSRQKFAYLPEATTDSIFAIIGEEFGFFGCFFLLLIYLYIFYKGYKIAVASRDKFGQLLAMGLTLYLFWQTVINLAGMVSLIPLTGVPLPFISYGGSSLIVAMISIGILLNIEKQ